MSAHLELRNFCPGCFADDKTGSWGETTLCDHCFNCGSGGTVQIPQWAVDSIRRQASWVGKRYYPCEEDKERAEELAAMRLRMPDSHGRFVERGEELGHWTVTQTLGNGRSVTSYIKADSEAEALAIAKPRLPFVPKPEEPRP